MNKYKTTVLLLITFFSINTFADNYPTGARQAGMGNSAVTTTDIWSLSHNQAGLAFMEKPGMGFHYENRYIVPEYGLQSFAFGMPTKVGAFGASLSYFGYSKYNETKVGLAYAKKFSDVISVGIQFDYLNYYLGDYYGNTGTVIGEIGILAKPNEKLSLGAHVYNPTLSQINAQNVERIPTIFKLGMSYKFSDRFLIAVETEKDIDFGARFRAGIEYFIVDNVALRTGIMTNPFENSFGIGYYKSKFRFNLAFSRNSILGYTPHVSIGYMIK